MTYLLSPGVCIWELWGINSGDHTTTCLTLNPTNPLVLFPFKFQISYVVFDIKLSTPSSMSPTSHKLHQIILHVTPFRIGCSNPFLRVMRIHSPLSLRFCVWFVTEKKNVATQLPVFLCALLQEQMGVIFPLLGRVSSRQYIPTSTQLMVRFSPWPQQWWVIQILNVVTKDRQYMGSMGGGPNNIDVQGKITCLKSCVKIFGVSIMRPPSSENVWKR